MSQFVSVGDSVVVRVRWQLRIGRARGRRQAGDGSRAIGKAAAALAKGDGAYSQAVEGDPGGGEEPKRFAIFQREIRMARGAGAPRRPHSPARRPGPADERKGRNQLLRFISE